MQQVSYVCVSLLKGWRAPLWYVLPARMLSVSVGTIVRVTLRRQFLYAVVTRVSKILPSSVACELKEVVGVADFPDDGRFDLFLRKVSDFYFISPTKLYKRLLGFLDGVSTTKTAPISSKCEGEVLLTDEQSGAVQKIGVSVRTPEFRPVLLHGVTGSGKTEVYKELIKIAFEQGKTTIFMLPEVSLSARFEQIFRSQLSNDIPIRRFDSGTSVKQRRALWNGLGEPSVIIGVHLPVLLPIPNLGLIIVDEEHDRGFVEKRHPRINSKEMAIWRAKEYGVPIVLGSATPSLATIKRVKVGKFTKISLSKRFVGDLPKISVVSLKRKSTCFWITSELEKAINGRLERNEQVLIFLNRRGHSFFVQCGGCGYIFECPNCSVSLTLHNRGAHEELRCHYCDFSGMMPEFCAGCEGKKFLKKGIGVQKLMSILKEKFPSARIAGSVCSDHSGAKREAIFESFYQGEYDILVGTNVITKGLHFPRVTLVGVIWGDLDFNFPTFDAKEHALQQLVQVAGRAGRSTLPGSEVIIQTLSENFSQADEDRYLDFCEQELIFRQELLYPPCGRLVQVELYGKDVLSLEREASFFARELDDYSQKYGGSVVILGPGKPQVSRIKNVEIRQILLKAETFKQIHLLLRAVDRSRFKSTFVFQPVF